VAADCIGFGAVARADATLLLLGSMPGRVSLEAAEYYAHPRNAFWWLAGELWGIDPAASYPQRLLALQEARVALWDVLQACERDGSLDSAIHARTERAQPLARFLGEHPGITMVACNGAKAEQAWRRHVLPQWPQKQARPRQVRLDSSSPAHAAKTREQKLVQWRAALGGPRI